MKTLIVIFVIFVSCLIFWMRCAYVNTYQEHVVCPVVQHKWKVPVRHHYKGRYWIDTTYMMCVKSPNYGFADLNVDDITYQHQIHDTLFFKWTNKRLSVFNQNYDKGLLLDFTFVTLFCIMIVSGIILLIKPTIN